MSTFFEQSLQHKAQEQNDQQKFVKLKNETSRDISDLINLNRAIPESVLIHLKTLLSQTALTEDTAGLKKIQTAIEQIKAELPSHELTTASTKEEDNLKVGAEFLKHVNLFATNCHPAPGSQAAPAA